MAEVARAVFNKCRRLLTEFPVLIIIGTRQAGKTSLAKILCPKWTYFDLEKLSHFDLLTSDPEFFFDQYPSRVIIDEAQESPEIFKVLRGVVDEDRKKTSRFVLTGSSNPALIEIASESLAGRAAIVELGTLKASEYYQRPLSSLYKAFGKKIDPSSFKGLRPQLTTSDIRKFWLRGGYPEPVLHKKKAFWSSWMEQYFITYINRDIRKLFPNLDLVRFRRFVNMLAKLSGSLINKSQIAAAINVSEPMISDYLDMADGTFIWRKLHGFESAIYATPHNYLLYISPDLWMGRSVITVPTPTSDSHRTPASFLMPLIFA